MKSKLVNDKINCRVLVLVSGAPLFHVTESVLLLPPAVVQRLEATVEDTGTWECSLAHCHHLTSLSTLFFISPLWPVLGTVFFCMF